MLDPKMIEPGATEEYFCYYEPELINEVRGKEVKELITVVEVKKPVKRTVWEFAYVACALLLTSGAVLIVWLF